MKKLLSTFKKQQTSVIVISNETTNTTKETTMIVTFEVEKANPSRKIAEKILKRRALEWAKKTTGKSDVELINWQTLPDTFRHRWELDCNRGGKLAGGCFIDGINGGMTFILKEREAAHED